MQRFFVPPEILRGEEVRLEGEAAHQISRVLRMRPGEEVVLLDGLGSEYRTRLDEVGKEGVLGTVVGRTPGAGEPRCEVTLYLSLLNKPDKFEWALQKCTELGAASFVPVQAERSLAAPPEKGRRERWERIIKEAAEQSGRAIPPLLNSAVALDEALEQVAGRVQESAGDGGNTAIMPALGAEVSLSQVLSERERRASLSLFIGPEGGFSADEQLRARQAGVRLVSLGSRTLRAETAAVAAVAVVMYALGEMGERT